MSDGDRYLSVFPDFLKTLGTDAAELADALVADEAAPAAQRFVAGALNYLFKSLDLIPDGVEDLGFIDDAFVLRVASGLAIASDETAGASIAKLAEQNKDVRDFLGESYLRLENYVRTLTTGAARGRTVDDILATAEARSAFASEVHGWSDSYEAPSFTRDPRTLTKLKAFLDTKLPK